MSSQTTTHTVIWTSEDGQGTIDMSGEYRYGDGSVASVYTAIEMARAELIAQCAGPDEYYAILAGSFEADLC